MKVLLVYPNIVESPKDISLGLAIISSLLKQHNHQVELIDTTFKLTDEEIINKAKQFQPDYIAVTAATNDLDNAIRITNIIKGNAKTICGGYHATVAPEDCIKHFDIVAIGEAEQSLIKLLENPDNTNIPNLWIKTPTEIIKNKLSQLNQDLDTLPFADREIFDYQKYINSNRGLATFMSSKGCPFLCSYCINKVLIDKYKGKGKFLRFRSIHNLIKEIKEVTTKYKVKEIEFYDDTFTLNKERLKEFSEIYPKEIGLPFYINARVNAVTKEDFELLKKAGCVRVSLGIESGNPKLRNEVLKRFQTNQQIIDTFKWARQANLKTYSFNMIGIPYETKQTIKDTIELNKKCKPDFIGVSIFNAYKGTELYDICKNKGWLIENNSSSYFQSSNVKHPNFTVKELKKIRDSFGFQVFKHTNTKRAYIDLVDKKLAKVPFYSKARSFLIEKGVKKLL
jgi:anaerobic magnesium-protoporphyrin IX monomethyl ester cyclase